MMPPGVPPIGLFRTFVRNLPMARAMSEWGTYELSRGLSLSLRDREILIDRTCARCGCEYELGVHVAFFAEKAGITEEQAASLAHGSAADPCWDESRDRLLILLADQLHRTSTFTDSLWTHLAAEFDEAEILDALLLCGWYHAISYAANAAGVDPEEKAPRLLGGSPLP
ncbi:carboxymuconolactone decarboxylase family protein [Nocardioides marmorisolisilvae]|uniref:Carboxymuconolactone decarboxylase family protein n=2 Tax=Nocardioides marmorisolisilvae TaxID=1542737 RepID=A0A3N0DXG5_9ACTN|nr:carboxymuconolactone decarboxylase family protein [Nocardioides marmorisolisilvae]